MIKLHADLYFHIATLLTALGVVGREPKAPVSTDLCRMLSENLHAARPHLTTAGLSVSLAALDRLVMRLQQPDAVKGVGRDLRVSRAQGKGALPRPHLFGDTVTAAFPSAARDIDEAGKCLALRRGTACVFHLMRVMEVGLRELGRSLNEPNLDPKRNPTWDRILSKCDDELRKKLADRCPEWQTDEPFYSTAAGHLHAVKNAWRNRTIHVEQHYDEEAAEEIFYAVRGFTRHLATKLRE